MTNRAIKKRTITTKPDGTRVEEIEYDAPYTEPVSVPYFVAPLNYDGYPPCQFDGLPPGTYQLVCTCPRCSPWSLSSTATVLS